MPDRERLSVQVDHDLALSLRNVAKRTGQRLSDVIRSALGHYLDELEDQGTPPAPNPSPPAARPTEGYIRVKGFWWADFDDVVQRAHALSAWSQQDRSSPPSPLPFRPSAGEDPETVEVEANFPTVEAMWDWIDLEIHRFFQRHPAAT